MKSPCRLACASLVAAILAVSPAPSAEPADPNRPPAETDEPPHPAPPVTVVVEGSLPYVPKTNTIAARLPVPLRLTPASVGIVTDPLLVEQRAAVLGDALRNVSGLNVQTQSGVADYFLIRGFDSLTSGVVLTDGALEPEVTFYPLYNVERIEVLKGPGGFLYGRNPFSGAMAGAVNIVRHQPERGTFTTVGAGYGTHATWTTTLDTNLSNEAGDRAFRLNAAWGGSDFWRDDKENDTLAVNPAFTWRRGDRLTLNVNLEYVDASFAPDGGLPLYNGEIAAVPRTRSYQSPFDASDQTIGRGQIDLEAKVGSRWTIRDKLYHRDLDWETDGTILAGVFPSFTTGRPEVARVLTSLDDRQRFTGNLLEGLVELSTGSVRHDLLVGLDLATFGDESTLDVFFLPSIDLENPVETAASPLTPVPGQSAAGDSRTWVAAPYAIDRIRFSEKWEALAGLRYDRIDTEDDATGQERTDGDLSPMLGVSYSPAATFTLYGNAGRSFGPPSPRIAGDPEPEEGTQVEVGAKKEALGGRLLGTVAVYRMTRDNIGIPDDNGFTQQAGDQESRGIELELAAEPVRGLKTFLSCAWNDAELTRFTERIVVGIDPNTFTPIYATVDRSGNRPAFAPERIVNAWVSHRFENGFGIGGGARYVSEQAIAEDNAFEIDSWLTFDAALYYSVHGLELQLTFKNITDREYETRGFGSASVIPAAPFEVFGGARYRF